MLNVPNWVINLGRFWGRSSNLSQTVKFDKNFEINEEIASKKNQITLKFNNLPKEIIDRCAPFPFRSNTYINSKIESVSTLASICVPLVKEALRLRLVSRKFCEGSQRKQTDAQQKDLITLNTIASDIKMLFPERVEITQFIKLCFVRAYKELSRITWLLCIKAKNIHEAAWQLAKRVLAA
jgi:hypothetical protein